MPKDGAEGLEAYVPGSGNHKGRTGKAGEDRGTGGGAQGGSIINHLAGAPGSYVGYSTGGNSYAGGNAGGSVIRCNLPALPASYSNASKSQAGNATVSNNSTGGVQFFAGGSAGIKGSNSQYFSWGYGGGEAKGEDGVGGLLMLYSDTLTNYGKISSEGSKGAGGYFPFNSSYNGAAGGGGSGGGSVNIFTKQVINAGDLSAKGGEGGKVSGTRCNMGLPAGGNGGDGTVTINELGSVLNYPEKEIVIQKGENYLIEQTEITYTKLNDNQTDSLTLGNITYELIEGQNITLDQSGNITATSKGTAKIKITDETNEKSTYLIIKVIENIAVADLKNGENHTVALKENGTVWQTGVNGSNVPIQLQKETEEDLENIIKIDAKDNSGVALDKDGNVYTWEISTKAKMVAGINNIRAVSTKGGTFYAVNKDGKAYSWGNGKSGIEEVSSTLKYIDVNGELLLGEDGRVYKLSEPEIPVQFLNSICEISEGENHGLFRTLEDRAYSIGDGTLGQLGNGLFKERKYSALVRTEESPLEGIRDISAGNSTSMLASKEGKVYVFGDNTNKKLGIDEAKTTYPVELTKLQDLEGNEIPLNKIEIVSTYKEHSAISDEEGSVYTVGLNTKGELGTGDKNARQIFTKIDQKEIRIIPEEINLPVGTSQDIVIELCNSFNLKKDIAEGAESKVKIRNGKEALIQKYENVDNSLVTNIKKAQPNYKLTGEKIGRTCIEAENLVANNKNTWLNIVSDQNAKASAKVVNGNGYTVALRSNGTIWSFGTLNGQNAPAEISTKEEIIDISSGYGHIIALGKSGKVYTLGANGNGQLGTGNSTTYYNPVELGLKDIVSVTAIQNTSFAEDKAGKIYAWGNGYTKVPQEINVEQDFETRIGEKVEQISVGSDFILILGKSGRAFKYSGGTVTAIKTDANTVLEDIKEISAGYRYSAFVTKQGKVYMIGDNDYEKLGVSNDFEEGGIQESEYAILKEEVQNIERVTAGYNHTSVYDKDGNVYTWGKGENGELGNGENFNSKEAKLVGRNLVQANTLGLTLKKGETFDVEANIDYFNLFVDKTSQIEYSLQDTDLANIDTNTGKLTTISAGRTAIIAREVGTNKKCIIPLRILENSKIEPMAETSGAHTIMLKSNGTVWTFGIGDGGELGTGKNQTSDEPAQAIFPDGTEIIQVACGERHNLALDSQGNVWAWGTEAYGELGSTNQTISTPSKVPGLSNIKKIACGAHTSYAVTAKGEVYSFGLNENGEGGIGSYTSSIKVTKAKNLTGIIDIKAGKNHVIALKNTGEVYASGSNLYGELGRNSVTTRKTKEFIKVPNLSNIVMVGAGDTHSMALDIDGNVWTWGSNLYKELGLNSIATSIQTPTKVDNLQNIRFIDGGKGTSIAIDKQGNTYTCGLNQNGQLGLGNNQDTDTFQEIPNVSNAIYASTGNTYTVLIKEDGTVWGTGDYAHGDEEIKSKTKGNTLTQIGNEETGLQETEITIKVGESKNITSECAYEFNLIYENKNFKDSLTYNTLKQEIAEVDSEGQVTGIKVGVTRVNALSATFGKTYSVLVKVIPQSAVLAPKVEGGDNFGAVLKADGNIYTFGYNGDGRLALENYETKDIPTKVDMKSGFKDIALGENFIIAMREDGTVWASGNNKKGQLGDGTKLNNNRLTEVKGIKDAIKISAGRDLAQILDSYGNIYQIGGGYTSAVQVKKINGKVVDLSCGVNQSAYVTSNGKVFGYGDILNGEMPDIETAIKAVCTQNSIVILTANGEIHEYTNGVLTKINMPKVIIDLKATENTMIYQTVDEETYIGTQKVTIHGDNTFGVGVGATNTYIIENTGEVYSAGTNTYGSIGNGTRDDSADHTLVGDRNVKIDPINKTMTIGETEHLNLQGAQFNVFGDITISKDDYKVENDNETAVSIDENGTITALAEGVSNITITDKTTGRKVTIKRKVERELTDDISIKEITATSKMPDGSIEEVTAKLIDGATMTYEVAVNDLTDISKIKAVLNEPESEVGVNGNAYAKLQDEKNITLTEDITEIKIHVKSEKGTIAEYTLIIRKEEVPWEPPEINIVEIYAQNGDKIYKAKKLADENYEVRVPYELTEVDVTAITEYIKDKVQVGDTGKFVVNKDTQKITLKGASTEVLIKLQSEDGTVETECNLTIVKMSDNANLERIEVDGEEATLGGDGKYHYMLKQAKTSVTVKAISEQKAPAETYVTIDNSGYELYEKEKTTKITSKQTESIIKVKAENGNIETYTLIIEGLPDDTSIKQVVINGEKATYIDGKNRYEIRSSDTSYNIEVTLNDILATLTLGTNTEATGSDQITINKTGKETTIKVTVTAQNGIDKEDYIVAILEKSSNNNLDIVKVNGKLVSPSPDGIYKAGISMLDKIIEIEATAEDTYAKTAISGAGQNSYIATKKDNVEEGVEVYVYTIKVVSEDGQEAEYTLQVTRLEVDYNILSIKVGKDAESLEEATLEMDGKYHYKIDRVEEAIVEVTLQSEKSSTEINGGKPNPATIKLANEITEVPIRIIAEDGSYEDTILVIEKKSNDVTLKEVKGTNITKVEREGNTVYVHIDEDTTTVSLDIILNHKNAKLKLSDEDTWETNRITREIDLSTYEQDGGKVLLVEAVAEDGETTAEYIINFAKKANLGLESVVVNGINIEYNEKTGKYEAVVANGNSPLIEITAKNAKETITLINEANTVVATGTGTVQKTETLSTSKLIDTYTIRVTAQDETSYGYKEYALEIRQKSTDTSIQYVKVDGWGTIVSEDGLTYTSEVSEKNIYPIEIKLTNENGKVRLEDVDGTLVIGAQTGILTGNVTVKNGESKVFRIVVTSENGEEKEYNLELTRPKDPNSYISGKILTENVNGEYISDITVYKITEEEITNENGETEIVTTKDIFKQTKTDLDGTFRIIMYNELTDSADVLTAKYELVVTKEGYLNYTIEEITLEAENEYDIGEYKLIAGDIVEDGEITLEDLVAINDYYGSIGKTSNDLNEDGTVDLVDRTILKKNYGKKAEKISWTQIVK